MPKGRVAELKKNQRELAASTKGYTKSTGSTFAFWAFEKLVVMLITNKIRVLRNKYILDFKVIFCK
jgi:hypothetical protein